MTQSSPVPFTPCYSWILSGSIHSPGLTCPTAALQLLGCALAADSCKLFGCKADPLATPQAHFSTSTCQLFSSAWALRSLSSTVVRHHLGSTRVLLPLAPPRSLFILVLPRTFGPPTAPIAPQSSTPSAPPGSALVLTLSGVAPFCQALPPPRLLESTTSPRLSKPTMSHWAFILTVLLGSPPRPAPPLSVSAQAGLGSFLHQFRHGFPFCLFLLSFSSLSLPSS